MTTQLRRASTILRAGDAPSRPRRLAARLVAATLLLGAAGCDELVDKALDGFEGSGEGSGIGSGDGTGDGTGDPGPDPYLELAPVAARFDVAGDGFYDLPWPTDLRTYDDGTLDLTTFPTQGGDLVRDYVDAIDGDVEGYSLMPVFYAGFEGSLEGASLPSPSSSLLEGAVVQLVELGAGCGARVPIEVRWREEGDNYHDDRLVIAVPVPGFALKPATTYAYVVRRDLGADLGRSAAPTEAFAAGLSGEGELAEHLAPLRACLGQAGLEARSIATAGVFTTQDPIRELRALRAAVRDSALQAPEVTAWAEDAEQSGINGRLVFAGAYDTPIYQQGQSPYASEGGNIVFDGDGVPEFVRWESVPFTVVWSTIPEPPYRLLVWSGGTGASQFGFVRSAVTDAALERGFVVANFVPQFHGPRATPGSDEEIHSFNLLNPDAFRNVFRQQVADTAYFLRLLTEANEQLPDLPELDLSRVVYAGHSQGALVGALTAGVETGFEAYAFNGLGAYLSLTALERTDPIDFALIVAGIADIEGAFDRTHPVLAMVQTGADTADTHAAARYWAGWSEHPSGHDVFVSNGVDDVTTPVRSMSAIAIAGGLSPISPPGWDVDPFGVWDVAPAQLPISGNRSAFDGTPRTFATYLSDTTGHFTIQQRSDVRALAMDFLESAATGEAVVGTP